MLNFSSLNCFCITKGAKKNMARTIGLYCIVHVLAHKQRTIIVPV